MVAGARRARRALRGPAAALLLGLGPLPRAGAGVAGGPGQVPAWGRELMYRDEAQWLLSTGPTALPEAADPADPARCTAPLAGAYGDGRGAEGFAPLVGVVCGGACYEEARRWSAAAVRHYDPAFEAAKAITAEDCQGYCAGTEGCAVWTLSEDAGGRKKCELKAAAREGGTLGRDPTAVSGARDCGPGNATWLKVGSGLNLQAEYEQMAANSREGLCAVPGKIFSSRCVLGVYGTDAGVLSFGVAQGWWGRAQAKVFAKGVFRGTKEDPDRTEPFDDAHCRALCSDSTECTGFTFLPVASLGFAAADGGGPAAGGHVCVLNQAAEHCPGVAAGSGLQEAKGLPTAVAGTTGCTANRLGLAPLPGNCADPLPRCRAPDAPGRFFEDG